MLPGNFKAVSSHFEVLSHSTFCSAPGDREDTKAPCVRNWGKKGKQVLTLGCKLLKAKGNSRLEQTMQTKHFHLQVLSCVESQQNRSDSAKYCLLKLLLAVSHKRFCS